jgi:hypothetical protein
VNEHIASGSSQLAADGETDSLRAGRDERTLSMECGGIHVPTISESNGYGQGYWNGVRFRALGEATAREGTDRAS